MAASPYELFTDMNSYRNDLHDIRITSIRTRGRCVFTSTKTTFPLTLTIIGIVLLWISTSQDRSSLSTWFSFGFRRVKIEAVFPHGNSSPLDFDEYTSEVPQDFFPVSNNEELKQNFIAIARVAMKVSASLKRISTNFDVDLPHFQPTTNHPPSISTYIADECFGAIAELLKYREKVIKLELSKITKRIENSNCSVHEDEPVGLQMQQPPRGETWVGITCDVYKSKS
ncbi:hypothetical protein V1477_014994 [Vespula maculifrons]|uniref:Uncharacterized protein n=1 Tax=Vespula maculifrons TaxID=7453 RepID=A0ABD2BK53_VESMC